MSENPAIHRRPSGDVDIALPHEDPDAGTVSSEVPIDDTLTDSGKGKPA